MLNKRVVMNDIIDKCYKDISNFYGEHKAKRSGVRLMNHIDEGIIILKKLKATDEAIAAFCLHPIFQDDFEWEANKNRLTEYPNKVASNVVEYRNKANSYLCRPETDHYTLSHLNVIIGDMSEDVRLMLLADKVQNRKDFILYHSQTHERSNQLNRYFAYWLYFILEKESLIDEDKNVQFL